MNKIKPSKIAIYTRVSTEQQAKDEEGSLRSQRERCTAYLLSSQGLRVSPSDVQVFEERGYSGKNTNRPAFQRLRKPFGREALNWSLYRAVEGVPFGDRLPTTVCRLVRPGRAIGIAPREL